MDSKIHYKKANHIKVEDLLKFLQDCRPDAEIFVSLYSDSTNLTKICQIINHGNYIQLVEKL